MQITDLYNIEIIKQKLSGDKLNITTVYELEKTLDVTKITREENVGGFFSSRHIRNFDKETMNQITNSEIIRKHTLLTKNSTVCGTDIAIPILTTETDWKTGDFSPIYFRRTKLEKGNKDCFKNLTKTKIIALSEESVTASGKEIENYLEELRNPENYYELITFLYQKLKECEFSTYYAIPPYLPKIIYDFFNEPRKEIIPKQKKAIEEQEDMYHHTIDIVLEIQKELEFLPSSIKEKYQENLSKLLKENELTPSNKIMIADDFYTRQTTFLAKLISLQAEILEEEKKELEYNPSAFTEYLNAFNRLSTKELTEEELEKKLPDIYNAINALENYKTKLSFTDFTTLHQQASLTLTNLLLTYHNLRDEIISELSPTYKRAIYLNIRNKLTTFNTTATDEEKLIIGPMLLDEKIEEETFIRKGLELLSPTPLNKALEKRLAEQIKID